MGEKKEKKEKKDKKEKKQKKEKKRKRQKVEDSVDDNINENDVATENGVIGGLPPAFYNSNEEEKDVSKESASDGDDGDAADADADADADATKDSLGDVATNAAAEGEDAAATPAKRKRKRKRKRKTESNEDEDDDDANGKDQAESTFDVAAMTHDTIFVEGIPFDKGPGDVREFFSKEHGIPDEDILELRLPTWQDSGRLRGFGHIRFATTKSYHKALGLNRKYMGRRYLTIQPAKTDSGNRCGKSIENPDMVCPEGCRTIYVNNLPYTATEEEIANAFSKHTPKSSIAEEGVRIARNSVTRNSKGFCYIDFETSKDAQRLMKAAIQKNVIVGGRMVRLDYDTGRVKGSFRTGSGQLLHKNHED